MGTELSLQAYWQQSSYYLALIIFSTLALNWLIICALADHPDTKAKLSKISLDDALLFSCIPPAFYLLAPYASDIMAALGTSTPHFKSCIALIHISIGLGMMCYLLLLDTVFLGNMHEASTHN